MKKTARKPKRIFVSGTYDILHGGHIQFFQDARALGDHLTVSFASAEVIALSKKRVPSLPDEHKRALLESIRHIDKVVTSSNIDPVFDFLDHWKNEKPDILAVTEDDKNAPRKQVICDQYGVKLVILPKRSNLPPTSTTSIITGIKSR